jgi:hypothetical protein
MQKFDVALSRIAVAGSILVTCAIAATNPWGDNRMSFETGGAFASWGGVVGITLMGSLAVLAIIDTFINDILPPQYHFHLPLKVRHLLFFLLAASQLGLIYNNVMNNQYDALLFKYAWDALISVVVVFADFSARHRRVILKGTE